MLKIIAPRLYNRNLTRHVLAHHLDALDSRMLDVIDRLSAMQNQRRMKICIIGASAVGKTNIISRFSGGSFNNRYQTTLGARITKVTVAVGGRLKELVVWDIKGESEFYKIPPAYLYGCEGYVLVADGTRSATCEYALGLRSRLREYLGTLPHLLMINKDDLSQVWDIDKEGLAMLRRQIPSVYTVSALTGGGIHDAMDALSREMWGAK